MFEVQVVLDELTVNPVIRQRIAVRGVIYEGNRILMVKTNRGDYKFPGGGVEEGESLKEALLREIAEETGYVDVEAGPCIGTAFEQNLDQDGDGAYFQMYSSYFVCRLRSRKRAEGVQDDYEEKLGFHGIITGIHEAYEANARMLSAGMDGKIPWLRRETQVLKRLLGSVVDKIALEVYECGKILLEADRSGEWISEKDGHANFVTTYDRKVQEELFDRLAKILPEAVFVGEEEDMHASVGSGYAFLIDPIDGTTNFIRDYKCSCISVGLAKDGKQLAGVVYNPYLNELFTAEEGEGAYRNGKRIHVSDRPLEHGLVLFGTAPYYEELAEQSFQMAYDYFRKALDVRRSGSAALDLCNVACGRAELYFELRLSPWDYAAGSLIVREAGGKAETLEGEPLRLNEPCSLIAANGIAGG